MIIPREVVSSFQDEILSWYKVNERDLPWRKTRDPYAILVSEVMSQQTQLTRVIPKYNEWLKNLPTVASLANAEPRVVFQLWSGLGYNRRALNLHKAAQMIMQHYLGEWPHDTEALQTLPGIGEYTAAAIACFAFDNQIPVVDTNIRKVMMVRFGEYFDKDESESKQVADLAQQFLPIGKAYIWNQALMDYSALVLKKEKIVVPKQSKFLGSRRSYRGKVVKLLIAHHRLSFSELWNNIQDGHSKDEQWFYEILDELVREGLIKLEEDQYFL